MPAHLISLDGLADIPIDRVLIVVGRHRRCDVRIESSRVSRRHCCLALDSGEVLIRDLGSTNGTWINGRRVEVGLLHPGDELSIAHIRFRLEFTAEAAVTSTPKDPGHPEPGPPARPTAGNSPEAGEPLRDGMPDPAAATLRGAEPGPRG